MYFRLSGTKGIISSYSNKSSIFCLHCTWWELKSQSSYFSWPAWSLPHLESAPHRHGKQNRFEPVHTQKLGLPFSDPFLSQIYLWPPAALVTLNSVLCFFSPVSLWVFYWSFSHLAWCKLGPTMKTGNTPPAVPFFQMLTFFPVSAYLGYSPVSPNSWGFCILSSL